MKIMSSSLPLLCFVQFVVLISALAVENATSEISLAENAILKLTEGLGWAVAIAGYFIRRVNITGEYEGIRIMGNPSMTAFAIGASDPAINVQALADVMETKGWKMERNQNPDSIHCTILPHHMPVVDKFLKDIEEATVECKANKALSKKGTAAVYGMMANIPDKGIVTDFLVEFFSEVYTCK